MTLLGITTAAGGVGVALGDGGGARAAFSLHDERRHTEALLPAIGHLLSQASASLSDVEVIAVDVGPGLFTGIRVGVATAQGLAFALGIGAMAMSSLDVLAREAFDAGFEGEVAAVVDARRGEVFAARYRAPGDQTRAPRRWAPAELAEELAQVPGLLAVGTGAHRYRGELTRVHVGGPSSPSPASLVALAADNLAAGVRPVEASALRPVYLREADARINWTRR